MPSTMIHLLAGYKVWSDAPASFWLGNIAPDAVGPREEKDETHFRNRSDRMDALRDLALSTNADPFSEGVLLHLFLDYRWDITPFQSFVNTYTGEDWFKAYRNEIALAGAWLFHNTDWSQKIWQEMAAIHMQAYGAIKGVTTEEVVAFFNRSYKWHMENNVGPSSFYSVEFVEDFTSNAVEEYKAWIEDLHLT